MPDEDEGTTEFRARGLKDLLESQEAPAKPTGGDRNRQMALIGGGVGAIVVVILAVMLLGGGGDDEGGGGPGDGTGVEIGLEMRPSAAVGVQRGNRMSVCDSESGPVAEGVVLRELKPAKSVAGQDIVQLTVVAEGSQINALGPTKAKSTWRAIASPTCPPVETTATTTTTLPPVQPPVSTPPDSTPTPPPS